MELVELLEDGGVGKVRTCASIFDAQGCSSLSLALKVRVELPSVSSMAEVELNVEVEHMSLRVHVDADDCAQHSIKLPAQCDPDRVGAKWSKKTKTLAVTLPLLAQQRVDAASRLSALAALSTEAVTSVTPAELQAILEQVDAASGEGEVNARKDAGICKDATTVAELQVKLRAAEAAAAAASLPPPPLAQVTKSATLEQRMLVSKGSVPEGTGGAEQAPSASARAPVEEDMLPAMILDLDDMRAVRSMVAKVDEASKEISGHKEQERKIKEELEATKALKAKVEAAAASLNVAAASGRDSVQRGVRTAADLARVLASVESKAKEEMEAAKAKVVEEMEAAKALKAHAEVLKKGAAEGPDPTPPDLTPLDPTPRFISATQLVDKCERLLTAAAALKASGESHLYTEGVEMQEVHEAQVQLARRLMQLALERLQHRDLEALVNGRGLPLDLRRKLCDIAAAHSTRLLSQLAAAQGLRGGGEGGLRGAGGGRRAHGGGVQPEIMSTHAHAPEVRLVDAPSNDHGGVGAAVSVLQSGGLVCCKGIGAFLSKLDAAKKLERKAAKEGLKPKAEFVAACLDRLGWVVCDQFVAPELVAELRKEVGQLSPHFTASEVWVGKEAGAGAQIVVPDVRGDKVLWMCGGHATNGALSLFDSAGDQPKTKGAVEPCDARVSSQVRQAKERERGKARSKGSAGRLAEAGGAARVSSAGLSAKFAGMRAVIKLVDAFVFEQLKGRVAKLARVVERSDAMLAVYPGQGTRFQRHIDNTAGDGRVLTVLIYLNHEWHAQDGGALRIFPRQREGRHAERGDGTPPGDKGHEGGGGEERVAVDVLPECGRVAMFFADEVPHEVRQTLAPRHAMTIWYYDEDLRTRAVSSAAACATPATSSLGVDAAAREQASRFIHSVLAPAGLDVDKGTVSRPTARDVEVVGYELTQLSLGARRVVAGILGASSSEELIEMVNALTPDSLYDLRVHLSKMGI